MLIAVGFYPRETYRVIKNLILNGEFGREQDRAEARKRRD
jgi:hypothetical protein